jgi:hypothetical protein
VSPDLPSECAKLLAEIAFMPARQDLMRRRNIVRAQFDAADIAGRDFYVIAQLGMQLLVLEKESALLPLSEESYLTIPKRHAALMQQMTERCKELTKARAFAAVTTLGAKLSELRATVPPPVESEMPTTRPAGIDTFLRLLRRYLLRFEIRMRMFTCRFGDERIYLRGKTPQPANARYGRQTMHTSSMRTSTQKVDTADTAAAGAV